MARYHLVRDGEIVVTREFAEGEAAPELAANKGVWLPEVVEDPPFDPATEVRGAPEMSVGEGSVRIERPVRAKTADEVAAMRQAKVAEIKEEASRRILDLYPAWKQANMTARGIELMWRLMGGQTWTAEETAEAGALQDAWAHIKAIRADSDALETALPEDAAAIAAFDPAQGWD